VKEEIRVRGKGGQSKLRVPKTSLKGGGSQWNGKAEQDRGGGRNAGSREVSRKSRLSLGVREEEIQGGWEGREL